MERTGTLLSRVVRGVGVEPAMLGLLRPCCSDNLSHLLSPAMLHLSPFHADKPVSSPAQGPFKSRAVWCCPRLENTGPWTAASTAFDSNLDHTSSPGKPGVG